MGDSSVVDVHVRVERGHETLQEPLMWSAKWQLPPGRQARADRPDCVVYQHVAVSCFMVCW